MSLYPQFEFVHLRDDPSFKGMLVCVCVSAEISTILCDVPAKARLVLDCVAGRQHSLKTLILMDEFDSELVAQGRKCHVEIISLKDAEASR